VTTWLAYIVLRSIDAASERASLLLDRWRPTIKFGKQLTSAEVDEHLTRLIDEATAPLRAKYDEATAELRAAAAEHRARSIALGRLEGQYAGLVAQGHCHREAIRDGLLRRN
jgi:hypothetical protein